MKHVILIPTYNESETIEKIISFVFGLYPEVWIKVIDDNSPDGTATIVRGLMGEYPHLSLLSRSGKEGLGRAYIHGFTEVMRDPEATHIIMMDADMSHHPRYVREMMEKSKTHDLVVGSRYVRGGKTVGWELWRRALSYFGNVYARIITRIPIHDLTGGFNCIRVAHLAHINLDSIDSSGYAFQIELKHLLYSHGGRLQEIPITFTNRTGGESKISNHIISEGILAPWKMIWRKRVASSSAHVCPLCQSADTVFFVRKNNHMVYKCRTCAFLFVAPIPEHIDVYDQSYFAGADGGFGYVDYETDKEPMVPTFEKYLDHIETLNVSGGRLLDVGAATGFFMNLAGKRGFETVGVELSDFAASFGRDKGRDVITGDLLDARFLNGYFDVVTMCDVLEHVTDPKKVLLEAKRILRAGGLLMLNTPNAESRIARLFGPRWHLIVPPEHLHYFSPKNLGTYLEKNGFEIVRTTTIGKRFTLQYIFKTLYKWQKLSVWNYCANLFSRGFFSRLYIRINLHDNFFMIVRKK